MSSKRAARGAVLFVSLDRKASASLHEQIAEALRQAIVSGRLATGSALPSTRALALDLDVSRGTVVTAFEHLRAEGYVESTGRGLTRVAATLPDSVTRAPAAPPDRPRGPGFRPPSKRARALAEIGPRLENFASRPARSFRTSVPALDVFPVDTWGRLAARRWRRMPPAALSYGHDTGLGELRQAIADYLTRARAVGCTADQVIVTNGSQQALDLSARVLADHGESAWVEDPGYYGAVGAFAANGLQVVPVPVDREGLDVEAGRRLAPKAAIAFVTPARHLPTGVSMSPRRRQALLAWAREARAWIIEDDYDSEFRYASQPLAPLQSQDADGSVVFVGTFSKVMFPALRLGYLVVPEALVQTFAIARRYTDFCPPYLTQATMADFLTEGHFERHIRRMRQIYESRRLLLVRLLTQQLGSLVDIDAPDAGMNLIVWLPEHVSDRSLAEALARVGIDATPVSTFSSRRIRPGLLLGYSGIREPDLREGAAKLVGVIKAEVGR